MNLKPLVLGLLAAACITAAAGGAFVAVRQNAAAPMAASSAVSAPGTKAPEPVTETEALVGPPAAPSKTAPAEAPDPGSNPDRTPRRDGARPAAAPLPAPARSVAPPRVAARSTSSPQASARSGGPASAEARPGPSAAPIQPTREPAPVTSPSAEAAATTTARVPDLPPAPPEHKFVEVVVPGSAVIGLQVDRSLSSETARVEDRIEARVTRDVLADGQRAIPAGSRMLGSVVLVDRGGKMKDPARLGVRFHTLVLADGTEMAVRTEAIFRDGESPGNESSRKIGGAAVGGAILGAILGGGKGALLGGATGAAGGTAVVMTGNRNAATLPAGAIVTAQLSGPVTIQIEKE